MTMHYIMNMFQLRRGKLITLQCFLKIQTTVLISQLTDSSEATESPGNNMAVLIKLALPYSHYIFLTLQHENNPFGWLAMKNKMSSSDHLKDFFFLFNYWAALYFKAKRELTVCKLASLMLAYRHCLHAIPRPARRNHPLYLTISCVTGQLQMQNKINSHNKLSVESWQTLLIFLRTSEWQQSQPSSSTLIHSHDDWPYQTQRDGTNRSTTECTKHRDLSTHCRVVQQREARSYFLLRCRNVYSPVILLFTIHSYNLCMLTLIWFVSPSSSLLSHFSFQLQKN